MIEAWTSEFRKDVEDMIKVRDPNGEWLLTKVEKLGRLIGGRSPAVAWLQPELVKNHKTGKRYRRLFDEPATTDCVRVSVIEDDAGFTREDVEIPRAGCRNGPSGQSQMKAHDKPPEFEAYERLLASTDKDAISVGSLDPATVGGWAWWARLLTDAVYAADPAEMDRIAARHLQSIYCALRGTE